MYEDNGIYLWHLDDYWYIGNDPCQDDYAAAYVYDDNADLVSLIGTWTEYQGSSKGWRANSDVYAQCRVDTPAPTPATPEPTPAPSPEPSVRPTPRPTPAPSVSPTPGPTVSHQPTPRPTLRPTPRPTPVPTPLPTTLQPSPE